jgi:hypothetical protein
MERSNKRLNVLARQVVGTIQPQRGEEGGEAHNNASPSSNRGIGMASTSGTTQAPTASSYDRIHGKVSRSPPVWRRIEVVAKEQLQEVLYDKAAGEGIAKVCPGNRHACTQACIKTPIF